MAGHRYLLGTNILCDLIKHPSGTVACRIAPVGETAVCTSIVVACELRYGAAKKESPALSGKIGQLLEAIEVLPLEDDSDRKYGEIRAALENAGSPESLASRSKAGWKRDRGNPYPGTGTFLELPQKRDRLLRGIVAMSVPDLSEF